MRIPAQKGDVLNKLTLQFGNETNLSDIKAIRLYYSGTEAPAREGSHFSPVAYVNSFTPGKTRTANLSYSVKQDEITTPSNSITLKSAQPMVKGENYYWVSIEMKPETSLLSRVSFTMPEATINNKPALIEWKGKANAPRRVGVGVRQAGDDGSAAFRIPGMVTTNNGTLLGVYDIRYNSSVDLQEMVDIGVSRSTDKGQTWEPMRVAMTFGETGGLPHAQNGVGDPSILVDEKQIPSGSLLPGHTEWVTAVPGGTRCRV